MESTPIDSNVSRDSKNPQHTSKSTKSTFLSLPTELRLLIFSQVLRNLHIDWKRIQQLNKLRPHALLSVCKTIRAEAGEGYFDRLHESLVELRDEYVDA